MLNKILDFIERYVTAFLFAAMCLIVMIQIILRTVGGDLSWCEEIARYLFVWIIYLASSKAMKDGKHLTVDILPIFLKGRAKIILNIIATLGTLAFFLALLYAGSLVLPNMLVKTQFSPANHINMIVPYLAPTVGTVLMTIRAIAIIIDDVKKLKHYTGEEEVMIHE